MITITVPAELIPLARSIFRALDPDVGGHLSFETESYTTPFDDPTILSDSARLHEYVTQDYATRWADFTPPTLADIESFVSQAVVS